MFYKLKFLLYVSTLLCELCSEVQADTVVTCKLFLELHSYDVSMFWKMPCTVVRYKSLHSIPVSGVYVILSTKSWLLLRMYEYCKVVQYSVSKSNEINVLKMNMWKLGLATKAYLFPNIKSNITPKYMLRIIPVMIDHILWHCSSAFLLGQDKLLLSLLMITS